MGEHKGYVFIISYEREMEKKRELKATEAKIASLYHSGNYATVTVGLTRKKRLVGTVEAEVRDEQRKLRVGQII